MSSHRARLLDLVALAALLALAGWLRAGELALIHDRGDQLVWAAVARNAAARGLAGYTVRGIDTAWQVVPGSADLALARAELAPLESGTLVQGLVASGETYWDAPLANQPPGFTALLVASHALLGRPDDGWPLLGRAPRPAPAEGGREREEALARRTAASPPAGVVRAQLWASWLPLGSDLVVVALLWLGGARILGSRRAALVAALAYATDPLALYASHRILSNATLAAASLGTLVAWDRATRLDGRSRTRGLALVGVLAGFAISVKVSAIFLLPAAVLALGGPRRWASREGALVLGIALALVAPWWCLSWKLLGNPLGFAWQRAAGWPQGSPWGLLVTGRGLDYYVRSLARSPAVLLGVAGSLAVLARTLANPERRRAPGPLASAALFALLAFAAAQVHSGGKEARHLLLVYPACLLVAASALEPLRKGLARALGSAWIADALLALALGAVFAWQARAGLAFAFDTAGLPP